jgi:hypothetical protein
VFAAEATPPRVRHLEALLKSKMVGIPYTPAEDGSGVDLLHREPDNGPAMLLSQHFGDVRANDRGPSDHARLGP